MKKYDIIYSADASKDIDNLFEVIAFEYKAPLTAHKYAQGVINTIKTLAIFPNAHAYNKIQ